MGLSAAERERYARHLSLPEIGERGQERLRAGHVALVGAGGLGSAAAFYLAAAGVGTLTILDDDVLAMSNLQRQILHRTADIGRPKVESAAERLGALNPEVRIEAVRLRLTRANAGKYLVACDFVVEATDNLASKFLIAEACHAVGKPCSHGGIDRFSGQTMTVLPGRTACYRCVFGVSPPEAAGVLPAGPLGAVPGVIGCIQATEAVKHLLGIGSGLTNRLLAYDALQMQFRCIPVRRSPSCPLCGEGAGVGVLARKGAGEDYA